MSSYPPIIMIGGFIEIIELCESCNREVIGIIDPKLLGSYLDIPVLGNDNDAEEIIGQNKNCEFLICPDDPNTRFRLFGYYSAFNVKFATLISPLARLSSHAFIGMGTIIQHDVNVSALLKIGNFVKLNYYSNITHNVELDDFVTIAPNAVVLGYVKVGKRSYIGSNATILPRRNIGESAVVGAGAVVTKDVYDNEICMGNPAAKLMK